MNSSRELSLFENTVHEIVFRAVVSNKELLHKYNFLERFQAICIKSTLAETLAKTKALCETLKRCSGPNQDLLQIDAFCRGLNSSFLNMGNSLSDEKALKSANFYRPTKVDLNYNLQKLIRMNHQLLAKGDPLNEAAFYFEVGDDEFRRSPAKEKLRYLDDCLVLLRQIFAVASSGDALVIKLCQHYSDSNLDFFVAKLQSFDRISSILNHVYACLLQMSDEVILIGRVERGTHLAKLVFSFMAMESSLSQKPNYRWLYLLRNYQFNIKQSPVTVERIFNGPGPLANLAKKLVNSKKINQEIAEIIKELAELGGYVFMGRDLSKFNLSQFVSQLGLSGGISVQEREICQFMLALPAVYCSKKYSQHMNQVKKLVVSCFQVVTHHGFISASDTQFYRRIALLVNAFVYGQTDAVNGLSKALSLVVECHELKRLGGDKNSPVPQRQRYLLNKINPVAQANLDFYGFGLPENASEAARYIDFLKIVIEALRAGLKDRCGAQKIIFEPSVIRTMALLGGLFETGCDNAMSLFCSNIYSWLDDAQGQLANDNVVGLGKNIMARYTNDSAKRNYYFTKLSQGKMLPTLARNAGDRDMQSIYNQVFSKIEGFYTEQVLMLFCQNIDEEFGVLDELSQQAPVTPQKPLRASGSAREKTPEQENFERSSEKLFSAMKDYGALMYRSTMMSSAEIDPGDVSRRLFFSPCK